MKTDRILILGNSITRHGSAPQIGWMSDCGMAASAPDRDFVHRFLAVMAEQSGRHPEARIANIADFERDGDGFDIATALKDEIAFSADLVIVAIGENVPALVDAEMQSRFRIRLLDLLAAVASRSDVRLFVRSCFWADPVKDAILRQACATMGGCFVDISALGRDEANYARAERSFEHDGVAAHPGDRGMQAIADALLNACTAAGEVTVHPAPREEALSDDYTLTVNGLSVPVYRARVSACPMNQVWPGYQRPLEQTELAAFAAWEMTAPVEVRIDSARPVHSVRVRPGSREIAPQCEGNSIRFTVDTPGQFTVEVNGMHRALHLFANPPEDAVPDRDDPNVRYFGPGVHRPGIITVESGQTVYLAGGAVVHGAILAEHAERIVICGRGILDGSGFDRMDLTSLICLYDCADVRIDGIILRDPPVFSIAPIACRQVHIRHVKLIGNWRYNSDGVDFISCQSCSVEDSFIRSFDDSICVKGYKTFGPFIYRLQLVNGAWDGSFTVDGVERHTFTELQRQYGIYPCYAESIYDIRVRRCVIWNDWGRALEIGAETVAGEIHEILFEDCDIIHVADVALDVQNCDHAHCYDIVFRDIRVEMDDDATPPALQQYREQVYEVPPDSRYLPNLITLEIKKGYVSLDTERGRIDSIRFERIDVTAPTAPPSRLEGCDDDHLVQQIAIDGLRVNGRIIADAESAGIRTNAFVRELTIS